MGGKDESSFKGSWLWKLVKGEHNLPHLANNTTLNQIRLHKEEALKSPRALSTIFFYSFGIDFHKNNEFVKQ